MNSTTRSRRRWRALAATAAAASIVGAGSAVADAATTPTPALGFIVATQTPTITRYVFGDEPGDSYLEGDLGANIVAGKDPFEIRAVRRTYADPIVANQVVTRNGRKTNVPLPAGMVTDFGGLKAFDTITMTNSAGATVLSETNDFCPGAYQSSRSRPDAPDSNPYPQGCGSHPFLIGNVWGIQAGWTSPLSVSSQLDLPDGTYTTTIEITQRYRDYFKLPADKAKATLSVNVVTVDYRDNPGAGARAKAGLAKRGVTAPKGAAHQHADEGDPATQVSAYSADLRPPTRRPATVAAAAVPRGPRPDLRALPALGVTLTDGNPEDGALPGHKYIAFGATVWNAGTSTLVVDGFRRTGTDLMDAYQYFYDANGKQVGSTNAGTMEWDKREGHKHWHFTDFAQYNLLSADKKQVVKSGKEAFCLANTDAVDDTIPNAKWRPSNTDLSSSCGQNTAVAVREVLDIGHGDTYYQYLPGQSFDITDLPNGTYYIQVKANPSNRLAELDTTNNTSLREVVVSGSGADRKITVPSVFGLDPQQD